MARQAPLPSKWLLIWVVMLGSCRHRPVQLIPAVFVATDQAGFHRLDGQLWMADTLFSGWQYTLYPTGDTAFVGGFCQGKAEGIHRKWYPNRMLQEVRQYQHGWQEGEQRGWHESGKPAFVYGFQDDVYEGRLREWYSDGRPARDGHYHDGHEAGSQRVWYADGSLKANYVVRNGRNYGFTGVKNCVNVWDSLVVSQ